MRNIVASVFALFLLVPTFTFAQFTTSSSGLNTTATAAYGSVNTTETIGTYIGNNIIKPALGVVGLIFLLLMIYAGFLWMTGGGNATQVSKAKDIMIAAVLGTIIVSAAYAITNFVFDTFV
jgi:uncharacterized membrane protein